MRRYKNRKVSIHEAMISLFGSFVFRNILAVEIYTKDAIIENMFGTNVLRICKQ